MPFSSEPRPPTRALAAFVEGWQRTLSAPVAIVGMLAATFFCALPLAMVFQAQPGAGLVADAAARGWMAGAAAEFAQTHPGPGGALAPEILGFGGSVANFGAWIDHVRLNPAIAGAIAWYLGAWIFLSGGLLDRFARARPIRTAAFFAACGVYFVRFLRLAVIAGAVYWALFHWLHPFLFGDLEVRWTRDLTDPRRATAVRAALYAAFLLVLMIVNVVVDFAKVRAVVEDRRSMIGAIAASLRFLRRRPFRAAGLYLLNALAFLVIVRLWFSLAPGTGTPEWAALFLAQLYLLARLWAKLAFMASEIAFFQGELAHAGYVAAPLPVWPDSPAVEALGRIRD